SPASSDGLAGRSQPREPGLHEPGQNIPEQGPNPAAEPDDAAARAALFPPQEILWEIGPPILQQNGMAGEQQIEGRLHDVQLIHGMRLASSPMSDKRDYVNQTRTCLRTGSLGPTGIVPGPGRQLARLNQTRTCLRTGSLGPTGIVPGPGRQLARLTGW